MYIIPQESVVGPLTFTYVTFLFASYGVNKLKELVIMKLDELSFAVFKLFDETK